MLCSLGRRSPRVSAGSPGRSVADGIESADIRQFKQIGINPEVLAFSFLTSVACGVLFGLLPALQSSRSSPNESLKEGERGSTANRGRTRSALVIVEVGLSLVLLVGAGLLVKSFARLMEVNVGFDPDHLLTFSLGLPSSTDSVRQLAFYQQVVQRLQACQACRP